MERRLTTFLACLFLSIGMAFAQTKVTGSVVSQEDGQPVIGASVVVVGTSVGTATDINGEFSLTVPAGKKTLRISSVGMESIDVPVRSRVLVRLTSDSQALDEVMVVAYGTAKKSSFTGSASTVSNKKLESRPVTSVTKALDGQVSGVLATSGSGQPGSNASIVIRGFGSINANNSPLYVVDGIPYDGNISTISPQDIESMTVLKDASASALYGSRAANGVVIITTKKGTEGRPQVSFHNTVGWSWRAIPKYETVNQEEFVQLSYEALRNGYQYDNGLSYENASKMAREQLGVTLGGTTSPELYNPFKNYTWDNLINSATGQIQSDAVSAWDESWTDAIYNKGAFRHDHQLQVAGGSERVKYLFSVGYLNEDGILKNTDFQRYSARGNVDSQVTDWFKAGLNTTFSHTRSNFQQYSSSQTSNVWYTAQFMGNIYPIYKKNLDGTDALDKNGNRQYDYGEGGRVTANDFNSLAGLYDDSSFAKSDNTGLRTYATFGSDKDEFGWAKGLKFTINFGADFRNYYRTDKTNKYHGNAVNAGGRLEKYSARTMSYTFNQQLTWNRKFGEHSLGALLAHEYYQMTYDYLYAGKTNIVDGIDELAPASTIYDATSYSEEHDIESWLGRINYNFAEKYYFDASLRTDGSSRFYKDNRWGTFWSVGANWRISSEEFMKNVKWVNNLSFKVSYGQNGNEGILDGSGNQNYYAWQNLYSLDYSNGGSIGGFVSTLENKELTWEKIGMLNIGLEGTLFDNRLRFGVEFFHKKTTDMLLEYPMPLSTGFSGYYANVGSMRNVGWEFMLGGTILNKKNITWNAQILASAVRNKVLKLTTETPEIISSYKIIKEGYDVTEFYMARSAGVDPSTGKQLYYAYKEMDDDGNVTGEYITDDYSKATSSKYFAGKRTPNLYGSISSDFTFFGCIDFSFLTTYSLGGKIFDGKYYSSMENMYYGNTWNKNILRRWQKPGDITDVPRVEISASRAITSDYLVDASYFAIKNITLGYTLPQKLARKAYLSKVRLYTSFDNVCVFTHLKGMDPQYNMTGTTSYTYTPNKTFSIGLDINF